MRASMNGLPCNTCGAADRHAPGCKKEARAKLFEQEEFKVLTLIQPMGTAIVNGPKRIENRVWAPSIRELGKYFFIHVGTKWDDIYSATCARLWGSSTSSSTQPPREGSVPYGAVIGAARLVGLVREAKGAKREVISIEGSLDKKSIAEQIFEDNFAWYMSPQWGWILDDVFDLPYPVHCRGLQRLWRLKPLSKNKVLDQIRESRW